MDELELWARQRLIALGWSNEAPGAEFSFEACLIEYQQFFGLPVSGLLDDATIASLQELRYCAHPDRMVVGEVRTLPLNTTWRFVGPSMPSVPDDNLRRAMQDAADGWSRVCPIAMREVTGGSANLMIAVAKIDGRNGVLADCELPGPQPQNMRLDGAEGYTVTLPPNIPSGRIGLVNVLRHELGHYLGLGHLSGSKCLMNPTYDPMIVDPQPGDVQAMQRLYQGAPSKPPTPVPTPTPGGQKIVIEIYDPRLILIPGYKVIPNGS